jgi:hypothetical protein
MRFLTATFAAITLLGLAGCKQSAWTSNFEPAPGVTITTPAADARPAVRVSRVPYERIAAYLDAERQAMINADVPPTQWPESQRQQMATMLVRQLQLTTDAPGARLLGRSTFTTTDSDRADEAALADAAAALGATHAVWASRHIGQVDRIDRETVFIDRWDTNYFYDPATGRYRQSVFPDRATASVPVARRADQYEFIAFFLR